MTMMTEKYPTWLIGHVKEWAREAFAHRDTLFHHRQ